MSIFYYLTLFPNEALIASELPPEEFGAYMSTGPKKGSSERLIFVHIKEEFGNDFDWNYAREKCVSHPNGNPKHSTYLSVYRVLERIPVEEMENLYLTTKDGRCLSLKKQKLGQDQGADKDYFLYQELCPIRPLVVSSLHPNQFADYIISDQNKITAPALFFTDLKVINFNDLENTGNIGGLYDHNIAHLKTCIEMVRHNPDKPLKTLDRSYSSRFTYQLINSGIYAATGKDRCFYPMPSMEELDKKHYDWARSAQIL